MKDEAKQPMSVFAQRVLRVCSKMERRSTKEEIRDEYVRFYPQSFIEKTLHLPKISVVKIQRALSFLCKEGFVHKENTIFLEHSALEKDIDIFWISNKGRSFLIRKK